MLNLIKLHSYRANICTFHALEPTIYMDRSMTKNTRRCRLSKNFVPLKLLHTYFIVT